MIFIENQYEFPYNPTFLFLPPRFCALSVTGNIKRLNKAPMYSCQTTVSGEKQKMGLWSVFRIQDGSEYYHQRGLKHSPLNALKPQTRPIAKKIKCRGNRKAESDRPNFNHQLDNNF